MTNARNQTTLITPINTKMVALRDTEEPIGDFKVCLCAICRHCLHCDANDPKSWEPLAWEGNFLSIIHHVKSQGQAF